MSFFKIFFILNLLASSSALASSDCPLPQSFEKWKSVFRFDSYMIPSAPCETEKLLAKVIRGLEIIEEVDALPLREKSILWEGRPKLEVLSSYVSTFNLRDCSPHEAAYVTGGKEMNLCYHLTNLGDIEAASIFIHELRHIETGNLQHHFCSNESYPKLFRRLACDRAFADKGPYAHQVIFFQEISSHPKMAEPMRQEAQRLYKKYLEERFNQTE